MTTPTLAVFISCFVAAPLLFALLLQFGQSLKLLLALALSVVACIVGALLMQAQDWMLSALALLGLSWVLAIAMVAVTLLRRISGARPRRWIVVIGILATTLPWFGFATARSLIP